MPAHTEAFQPPAIEPQNAPKLTQVAQIELSPWDLVHALAWSPDGDRLGISAGEWLHIYPYPDVSQTTSIDLGVWSPGLAFSPDGSQIATGGRDGVIQFWRASNGAGLLEFEAHNKGLNHLVYSPNGELLASGGNDAMARLWAAGSGEQQNQMIGGTFSIPAVEFIPDGEALAILNGNVVRVRDIESGRFVGTLSGDGTYFSLDITKDGRLLAVGGADNLIEIWDVEAESLLQSLSGHTGETGRYSSLIWGVEFSPDGDLLASAGGDGSVRLWRADTGEPLVTLTGHTRAVTSLAFSPDGKALATGSLDGRVNLWRVGP